MVFNMGKRKAKVKVKKKKSAVHKTLDEYSGGWAGVFRFTKNIVYARTDYGSFKAKVRKRAWWPFFIHNQHLIEYGYVKMKQSKDSTIIMFKPGSERHLLLFIYYLLAIDKVKDKKKIEKLAKCIGGEIDTVSPVIDVFRELLRVVGKKRFRNMIHGYCRD